jgi:hypothetical protein
MEPIRHLWARVTYWLLFIIAPSVAIFLYLGASVKNGAVCLGLFVVLILIGEHGFRRWTRFFHDQ